MSTPAIISAQRLVGHAIPIIQTDHTSLERSEVRKTFWGLAILHHPDKPRTLVAVSPLGIAHLVGRRHHWDYTDAPPDMATLEDLLAAKIKHAFKGEDPSAKIFSLPTSYGHCGLRVLICPPGQAIFAWLGNDPVQSQANPAVAITPVEWRDSLSLGRQSEEAHAAFAPPPANPDAWLRSLIQPMLAQRLPWPELRALAAASLRQAIAESQSRAQHLERFHPSLGVAPMSWMTASDDTVSRILDAVAPKQSAPAPAAASAGAASRETATQTHTRAAEHRSATGLVAGIPVLTGSARRGGAIPPVLPQPGQATFQEGFEHPASGGFGSSTSEF